VPIARIAPDDRKTKCHPARQWQLEQIKAIE
jgi:hypothetical protein